MRTFFKENLYAPRGNIRIVYILRAPLFDKLNGRRHKPCPFESGLRKFALDFVVVFFFKNAEKTTSGGLILSLENLA